MFTVTYEKCVTADEKGNRRALTVRRKKDTKGPLGHEESLVTRYTEKRCSFRGRATLKH